MLSNEPGKHCDAYHTLPTKIINGIELSALSDKLRRKILKEYMNIALQ